MYFERTIFSLLPVFCLSFSYHHRLIVWNVGWGHCELWAVTNQTHQTSHLNTPSDLLAYQYMIFPPKTVLFKNNSVRISFELNVLSQKITISRNISPPSSLAQSIRILFLVFFTNTIFGIADNIIIICKRILVTHTTLVTRVLVRVPNADISYSY